MSIRRDPIYISNDVHRWLRLLAKADNQHEPKTVYEHTTVDTIADQLLRQTIRELHPQITDYDREIQKLEKQTIDNLRTNHEKITKQKLGT